jgi:hypothetical protein
VAGTLRVIAATRSGWLSIDNPLDGEPGKALESIDDLRVRREDDLEIEASGTAGGIKADVLRVPGVVSANVLINDTETDRVGLPKHSVRVVLWDGIGLDAENDAVAQAILGTKGAATSSIGASSGSATDPNGETTTVHFDRATRVPLYVVGAIEVAAGADHAVASAAATAAILLGGPTGVGKRAVFERMKARAFSVPGVTDVLGFTLGTAPAPTGVVNVEAAIDQLLLADSTTVALTITEQAP